MKFGVSLFPLRPTQMVDVAQAAEDLGFDSVWLGEHVISPNYFESRYPYHEAPEGESAFHSRLPFYDPFAALSFVAARTEQVKLVLSVSIVPLHDPYRLARSVMTIDQFSGGRFVFGIGTGWLREEFEIVGARWEQRGARMEEMLELMTRLWSEPSVEHHGRFYELPPAGMEPKPLTTPHPPFVFGGITAIALRRTAELGDGWIGVGLDEEAAAEKVTELRERRAASSRRADPLEVSLSWTGELPDGTVDRLEAAGVDRVVVRPWTRGRDALDAITRFAERRGLAVTGAA
jgi:probable F420-dependent oxidoreductase